MPFSELSGAGLQSEAQAALVLRPGNKVQLVGGTAALRTAVERGLAATGWAVLAKRCKEHHRVGYQWVVGGNPLLPGDGPASATTPWALARLLMEVYTMGYEPFCIGDVNALSYGASTIWLTVTPRPGDRGGGDGGGDDDDDVGVGAGAAAAGDGSDDGDDDGGYDAGGDIVPVAEVKRRVKAQRKSRSSFSSSGSSRDALAAARAHAPGPSGFHDGQVRAGTRFFVVSICGSNRVRVVGGTEEEQGLIRAGLVNVKRVLRERQVFAASAGCYEFSLAGKPFAQHTQADTSIRARLLLLSVFEQVLEDGYRVLTAMDFLGPPNRSSFVFVKDGVAANWTEVVAADGADDEHGGEYDDDEDDAGAAAGAAAAGSDD